MKKIVFSHFFGAETLSRVRLFLSYMSAGPHQEWGRVSLCSLAPLSAGALRSNQEAERLRASW